MARLEECPFCGEFMGESRILPHHLLNECEEKPEEIDGEAKYEV